MITQHFHDLPIRLDPISHWVRALPPDPVAIGLFSLGQGGVGQGEGRGATCGALSRALSIAENGGNTALFGVRGEGTVRETLLSTADQTWKQSAIPSGGEGGEILRGDLSAEELEVVLSLLAEPDGKRRVAIYVHELEQLLLHRMVSLVAESFDLRILPAVRGDDGIAEVDGAAELSAEGRFAAMYVRQSLLKAEEMVRKGCQSRSLICATLLDNLEKPALLRVDAIHLLGHGSGIITVQPASADVFVTDELPSSCVLQLSVWCEGIRFLDYIKLSSRESVS